MKPKHIEARIKQCLAIAECSPCPRRKFGALLLDPERNVVLMDGYNGGPRGGGDICGGDRCLRDGLLSEQVTVTYCQGYPLDHPKAEKGAGVDDDTVLVEVKGRYILSPVGDATDSRRAAAHRFWLEQALTFRERLLAENPPIKSGTRMELGCHHAEMNVITNVAASHVSSAGAWLIVTGEPCILCAKLIHHSGITKVICVRGGFAGGDEGPQYLRKHGVEVEYAEGPQDPRSRVG